MPHEDRVTAALEEIRADLTSLDQLITRMKSGASIPVAELNAAQDRLARHTQPLLAAVDGALELHRPEGLSGKRLPDGRWVEHPRCWQSGCPDEWPCPTYHAISSALLGETAPAGEGR